MSNRILGAILCVSLAFSADRAVSDTVDPMEVLQAYEDAVGQYWENTRMSSSASFPKVTDSRTVYLSKRQVCLVSEMEYADKEKASRKVYTIGSAEQLLMIRDVDINGGNEWNWSLSSSLVPPDDAFLRPAGCLWGSAVVGVLAASTDDEVTMIPSFLREADTLTATRKTQDGLERIVLHAEHSRDTIDVQLIPSKDYVLYRLDYTPADPKPGRARTYSTQFSDFFVSDGLWLPRIGVKTLHVVPQNASPESISDTTGDKVLTIKMHLKPLRRLDQAHISGFIADILGRIQDGTRVKMNDAPHFDFEWRNGMAVLILELPGDD